MPIFLTIKNATGTKSSMLASNLSGDSNFPGNLIATGISGFYAELPEGKRLRVDAWSFKSADLDSYMVGEFEDGLFSMLGTVAAAQAAEVEAVEEVGASPEPAAPSTPAPEAAPRRRKK